MNLLSLLGPGLTAGTEAASGALAGQAEGQQQNQARMMSMIAQLRAQHEQELKDQLTTADTNLKKVQAGAGGFRPQPGVQPHWDETRGAWILPPSADPSVGSIGGSIGSPSTLPSAAGASGTGASVAGPAAAPTGGISASAASVSGAGGPPAADVSTPPTSQAPAHENAQTPPTQPPPTPFQQAPTVPKKSPLSSGVVVPQGLPDRVGNKTPRTFTEDGRPVQGFSDQTGKFYRADGTPTTGKIGIYNRPDPTLVQVNDPNNPGQSIYVPRAQAAGMQGKQTLKIESAQNTASEARLKAAVSEMNNANGQMTAYEQKLASGQADISGLSQFAGRVATAFTHDDPMSIAAQSVALASLDKQNPDLARYIRRGLSFAEGESMISNRPSDFRTKMAAFLSQTSTGASPQMIQDIQSRRTSILTPLNQVVPAQAPTPKGKTITQAQVKLLPAKLQTPAMLQQYGYTVVP